MTPFQSIAEKTTVEIRRMGKSRRSSADFTWSTQIKALTPRTRPILQIFDPITFPRAMSGRPRALKPILTNSSGALVPKATTVSPTTSGEMP